MIKKKEKVLLIVKNMARSKNTLSDDLSAKNTEGEEVPVAPCKGWSDPCEFCDKRFKDWREVSEDCLESIPAKPGVLLLALRSKGATETVDIALSTADLQKLAYTRLDLAKEKVSDKKSKFTKSAVVYRWMPVKSVHDKEVVTLLAHWTNNGVLPKFAHEWPGADALEQTRHLSLSRKLQKWCYPRKDPIWMKPRPVPSKVIEVVPGCAWDKSCETCDENFGDWKRLEETADEGLAPDKPGVLMVSAVVGKSREVVYLGQGNPEQPLRDQLLAVMPQMKYSSHKLKEKYDKRAYSLEVRWMVTHELAGDNSCFVFAHWLNSETMPMLNHTLALYDKYLNRNKNFVVRTHDKRWCYEIENFKQARLSKNKHKKQIMEDLEGDFNELNC